MEIVLTKDTNATGEITAGMRLTKKIVEVIKILNILRLNIMAMSSLPEVIGYSLPNLIYLRMHLDNMGR